MIENTIPRYQSARVLWMYRSVDLCTPYLILALMHFFFSSKVWGEAYVLLGGMSGLFLLFFTQLLGGYSRYTDRSIAKKLEIVFKTWSFNVLFLVFIAYLNLAVLDLARSVVLSWVALSPFSIFFIKLLINYKSRSISKGQTEILVLGDGYCFNESELIQLQRHNVRLHTIDAYDEVKLREKVESLYPDFLVINLDKSAQPELVKQLTHLNLKGIQLLALHHFMETFLRKCYIPYESTSLSYLERISAYSKLNYFIKRVFDISLSISLGLVAVPVMIYVAFKIRHESPGPVIFSQARVGYSGKEHTIYKFRSMHIDAEINGAQFATVDDPRAYGFGNFMRKTRIDELPQLWNVIKGDLHFVGPRPERKVFADELEEDIPYYNERHVVSPGITGWAQVMYSYGANTEDARQKLMYDLYYIKHWSIWLEIETLIRTVFVVLWRKGL